jgi:hypothetical protein
MLVREPEERQLRIKQRAAQLIAEELNLRAMRRLRKLAQASLSKKLKIGQEGVRGSRSAPASTSSAELCGVGWREGQKEGQGRPQIQKQNQSRGLSGARPFPAPLEKLINSSKIRTYLHVIPLLKPPPAR